MMNSYYNIAEDCFSTNQDDLLNLEVCFFLYDLCNNNLTFKIKLWLAVFMCVCMYEL